MNKFASGYLKFSRKDRAGTLVFILLILSVYFLPLLTASTASHRLTPVDSAWIASISKLEEDKQPIATSENRQYTTSKEPGRWHSKNAISLSHEVFYFDPNTLSADDGHRLGLHDKIIQTLHHFIEKGGRFRKPEDLKNIYGMRPDLYKRLAPYVEIVKPLKDEPFPKPLIEKRRDTARHFLYTTIDINEADTNSFIALPGIGNRLAARIIKFREKLGGFYSVEQVKETFGLPDSAFQKIKPYLMAAGKAIKKIDINKATKEELTMHPYIRWAVAGAIVEYRRQHGNFTRVEDLMKIQVIEQDQFRKFAPYLSL